MGRKATFVTALLALAASAALAAACEKTPEACVHEGGTATCLTRAICEKCGEEYGELGAHVYGEWKSDETNHRKECTIEGCGAKSEEAAHAYTITKSDDTNHWNECKCGAKSGVEAHAYTVAKSDDTNHWNECECGAKSGVEAHAYTVAKSDDTQHWNECVCGYETEKSNHVYSLIEGDVYDEYSCECGFKNEEKKFKKTVDNVDKDLVLSGTTCALDLIGVSEYASVESIKLIVGGTETDLGNNINALNAETLRTETQKHGKQTITVVVKTADGVSHTVLVPVVIVTKEISTMTELQDCVKWLGGAMDNIYGYYTLRCDITTESGFVVKNGGISYSSGNAFRGTLDGRGFSVSFNSSAGGCGLFGTMNGATLKNITIKDAWNNNGNRPMLAYNAYNVTFEKVKLIINNGGVKNGTEGYTPIIGASMHGCTFKETEIVSNIEIKNVFYDAKNNIFESLTITADVTGKFSKDIELTALPEGVTIHPKTQA